MSATPDDRRRSTRSPLSLKVEYGDAAQMVNDFTDNISQGGTFIYTSRELDVGQPVRLVLSFPGLIKPIPLGAIVKWTRGGNDEERGVGVAFEEVPPEAARRLDALISRIAEGDPRLIVRNFHVLIVEDNPHVATLIREGLAAGSRRELGGRITFQFTTVENGRDAQTRLGEEAFDVMITDIYLPVLDGISLIRSVRGKADLQHMPIIAMSAGGSSTREEACRAGADFFLSKPMRLAEIVATMRRLSGL